MWGAPPHLSVTTLFRGRRCTFALTSPEEVWFELDPKKYSVEDHPIAKHFLDWTRESEAVSKEKFKKSDYLFHVGVADGSRGRGRRVKLPSKLSANQQCWG